MSKAVGTINGKKGRYEERYEK